MHIFRAGAALLIDVYPPNIGFQVPILTRRRFRRLCIIADGRATGLRFGGKQP